MPFICHMGKRESGARGEQGSGSAPERLRGRDPSSAALNRSRLRDDERSNCVPSALAHGGPAVDARTGNKGKCMVTREELLGEAEWDADRALASAGLPALRTALRKLEWLDPENERLETLRQAIGELEMPGRMGEGIAAV